MSRDKEAGRGHHAHGDHPQAPELMGTGESGPHNLGTEPDDFPRDIGQHLTTPGTPSGKLWGREAGERSEDVKEQRRMDVRADAGGSDTRPSRPGTPGHPQDVDEAGMAGGVMDTTPTQTDVKGGGSPPPRHVVRPAGETPLEPFPGPRAPDTAGQSNANSGF